MFSLVSNDVYNNKIIEGMKRNFKFLNFKTTNKYIGRLRKKTEGISSLWHLSISVTVKEHLTSI